MATFKMFWKDGKVTRISGNTIAAAFAGAGYTKESVDLLDGFDELLSTITPQLVQSAHIRIAEKDEIFVLADVLDVENNVEVAPELLSNSLEKMMRDWENFIVVETPVVDTNGQSVFVICDKEASIAVIECVSKMAVDHLVVEDCDMRSRIDGAPNCSDFWWDVHNMWMAAVGYGPAILVQHAIQQEINDRKEIVSEVAAAKETGTPTTTKMAAFG
jgi:ATP-dependent protease HslVU (ClpYQ) peptidase subunit